MNWSCNKRKWWFAVTQQNVWNQIYRLNPISLQILEKHLWKINLISSNLYNGGYDVILFSSLFCVLTNTTVYWCAAEICSCCAVIPLWFIPPFFSWGWRQRGAERGRTVEFDRNINSVTGRCSPLWCFKPVETFSAASMRRRSSSNASGRSSTLRRRSENLRFDEFGFAILTKRKDVKLHHRCHEYRCDTLSRRSTLAPRV